MNLFEYIVNSEGSPYRWKICITSYLYQLILVMGSPRCLVTTSKHTNVKNV